MANKTTINISFTEIIIFVKYLIISFIVASLLFLWIYYLDNVQKNKYFDVLSEKIQNFKELDAVKPQTFPEFKDLLDREWIDIDKESVKIPLVNKSTNELNCSQNSNIINITENELKVTIHDNLFCVPFEYKRQIFDVKNFFESNLFYLIITSLFILFLFRLTDEFAFTDKSSIQKKLKSIESDVLLEYLKQYKDYFSNYHLKEEDSNFKERVKEFYLINHLYLTNYRRYPVIKKIYTEIIKSLNLSYSDLSNLFYIQMKSLEGYNHKLNKRYISYIWNKFFRLSSLYITSFLQLFLFIMFVRYVNWQILKIIWFWKDWDNTFLNYFNESISVMSNLGWNFTYVTAPELIFNIWNQMIWVVLFALMLWVLNQRIK